MYAVISVHTPHPEHREALIDSMHRFGAAMEGRPGLIGAYTTEDVTTGRLVGVAMFTAKEAAEELMPLGREAVTSDDFDTWEAAPTEGLHLAEV